MTKLIVRHALLALLLLSVVVACEIVETGSDSDQTPTPGMIDESGDQQVALGSGNIPNDPQAFGRMLHNDSAKTWEASEFALEGLSMFQGCRLDDVVTLLADGTYTYDGGTQLCGAEDDSRNRSGQYAFDATLGTLTFEPGTAAEAVAQLVTLEDGNLVFTAVYASSRFGSFDVTASYTATDNP